MNYAYNSVGAMLLAFSLTENAPRPHLRLCACRTDHAALCRHRPGSAVCVDGDSRLQGPALANIPAGDETRVGPDSELFRRAAAMAHAGGKSSRNLQRSGGYDVQGLLRIRACGASLR